MRAVIPAAGIGKRLRPHTLNVPKVMINLAGRRLIGHVLDAVESAGVDSVSIIVGYKGEQVEEYVNRYYSHLRLDFPYQAERKGLGHAVLEGLEDKDESVLILCKIQGDRWVVAWSAPDAQPDGVYVDVDRAAKTLIGKI